MESTAVPFEVWLNTGGRCYYCWRRVRLSRRGRCDLADRPEGTWSMERIDTAPVDDGYESRSVVPACCRCSEEKGDRYTSREFRKLKEGERVARGGPGG